MIGQLFLFHTQTFLCVEKYFLDQKYFGGLGFFKKSNLDSLIFKVTKFRYVRLTKLIHRLF
jgi:hypothetical protein